jgi:hypothetical protein
VLRTNKKYARTPTTRIPAPEIISFLFFIVHPYEEWYSFLLKISNQAEITKTPRATAIITTGSLNEPGSSVKYCANAAPNARPLFRDNLLIPCFLDTYDIKRFSTKQGDPGQVTVCAVRGTKD